MRLLVNGEPREVPDGTTVAGLLALLGVSDRRIAVEVNRQIVGRDAYGTCHLGAGDEVEIVHFVGGG